MQHCPARAARQLAAAALALVLLLALAAPRAHAALQEKHGIPAAFAGGLIADGKDLAVVKSQQPDAVFFL